MDISLWASRKWAKDEKKSEEIEFLWWIYTTSLKSLFYSRLKSLSFFCCLPIKFHLFSGCWKVPQQHELTLVYLLVRQIKVANERESCVCCPSSEMMANRAYQFRLVKKLTLALIWEVTLFYGQQSVGIDTPFFAYFFEIWLSLLENFRCWHNTCLYASSFLKTSILIKCQISSLNVFPPTQ